MITSTNIIEKIEKYLCILNITKRNFDSAFSLGKTTLEEVSKVIRDLNTKSVQTSDTLTKIIKLNSTISQISFTNILTTVLTKMNFRMIRSTLLFQHIRKIKNAKKKTVDR